MKIGRNDACHCGSNKKFKDCHGSKKTNNQWRNIAIIGLIAIALVWFISDIFQSDIGGSAPPGKVWSEEHGHYHDIAGSPSPRGINPGQAQLNVPQPEGPVPEGKVWSTEHGHWHDIAK